MADKWILVNIGCIECGVSSGIVGVFSNESRAREEASRLDKTHSWREGGQNRFEVFRMPTIDVVAEEYTSEGDT